MLKLGRESETESGQLLIRPGWILHRQKDSYNGDIKII